MRDDFTVEMRLELEPPVLCQCDAGIDISGRGVGGWVGEDWVDIMCSVSIGCVALTSCALLGST